MVFPISESFMEDDLTTGINDHMDPKKRMRAVRNRILNFIMVVFSVLALIPLIAEFVKASNEGWTLVPFIYTGIYFLWILITLFGRKVPFTLRTSLVLITLFLSGTVALLTLGLSGGGQFLLLSFVILSSILLGRKWGILSMMLIIPLMAFVGYGMVEGIIEIETSDMESSLKYSSWMAALGLFIFIGVAFVLSHGALYSNMMELLYRIRTDNIELRRSNKKMRRARSRAIKEKKRADMYLDLLGHDIGNIHQGVSSGLELARTVDDEKMQTQILETCDDLIKRSVRLVNNVLLVSRLKDMEADPRPVDVVPMIRSSLYSVLDMNKGSVDVEYNMRGIQGKIEVLAEPIVEEVFFNLIHNSIKYQLSEKAIIDLELVIKGSYMVFTICDHGIGVSDENKSRILSRAESGQGDYKSGIGLSLVKTLVDRYGGEVKIRDRVEGDHSKGACFIVKLPLAR